MHREFDLSPFAVASFYRLARLTSSIDDARAVFDMYRTRSISNGHMVMRKREIRPANPKESRSCKLNILEDTTATHRYFAITFSPEDQCNFNLGSDSAADRRSRMPNRTPSLSKCGRACACGKVTFDQARAR